MTDMILDVNVGTFLRQWVMASEGSDTVSLGRKSNLWGIVKSHMVVAAATDMSQIVNADECIHFRLMDCHSQKTWSAEADVQMHMNTMFRCYLDQQGHNLVKRFLEQQLRVTFLAYMVGNMNTGDRNIAGTVTDFLVDYSLPISQRQISSLTKAWYRYRLQMNKRYHIPIFF